MTHEAQAHVPGGSDARPASLDTACRESAAAKPPGRSEAGRLGRRSGAAGAAPSAAHAVRSLARAQCPVTSRPGHTVCITFESAQNHQLGTQLGCCPAAGVADAGKAGTRAPAVCLAVTGRAGILVEPCPSLATSGEPPASVGRGVIYVSPSRAPSPRISDVSPKAGTGCPWQASDRRQADTAMLHPSDEAFAFDERHQLGEVTSIVCSRACSAYLAEACTGRPAARRRPRPQRHGHVADGAMIQPPCGYRPASGGLGRCRHQAALLIAADHPAVPPLSHREHVRPVVQAAETGPHPARAPATADRRGYVLASATLAARSVALAGFGLDSLIEIRASAWW